MKPDPVQIDALKYIIAPANKDELISFLCMTQISYSDFIEHFAQKAASLGEISRYIFLYFVKYFLILIVKYLSSKK